MASESELKEFAKQIDSEITQLRNRLTAVFYANMDKYGIVASGQLKTATKINQNILADDMTGGLEVLTLKYGILLHARKKFVVKAPAAKIIEWIKTIGLSKFKYVPGYKDKFPTEDLAIRRIAWGIKQHGKAKKLGADAIIKSKSGGRETDPWLYKDFYKEVKSFQENLASKTNASLAKDVANAMRRQLLNK